MTTDANDIAKERGADGLRSAWDSADVVPLRAHKSKTVDAINGREITAANAGQETETPAETVARLASLKPFDYDRLREAEAKTLGIRVGTLDAEVKKLRPDDAEKDRSFLEDPVPWPDCVDGDDLLERFSTTAADHLILPSGAADALALWSLFAHAHDAFSVSPVLCATSPTPACGKTTLLTFLGGVVPRPLPASNISPAAFFRAVEKWCPCVLVDEADTFLRDNDELRGILNSGHSRAAAFVVRTQGEEHEPARFSTWAPKAIALIGKLPATLASRAIHIELRRMRADEQVKPLRLDRLDHLPPLQQQAARWAADNIAALRQADPTMPPSLFGRAADNWRPLIAIADVAGGNWPQRARSIASRMGTAHSEQTIGIMLLEDIRAIFKQRRTDRLASAELIEALIGMEHRPWPEFSRGKPLTPRQLAKMLDPFGVTPGTIRSGAATAKGYHQGSFDDAFRRYLPILSDTPSQPLETLDIYESRSVTGGIACDG
jgi:putative DNA primase/helicase